MHAMETSGELRFWKIAPRSSRANTMVINRRPTQTSCTLKLGELLRGHPAGWRAQHRVGGNDLGAMVADPAPDVRKISCTGSTATGRKIIGTGLGTKSSGTRSSWGGSNDPAIRAARRGIEKTAKGSVWATRFQNRAQFCVAAKRL